MNGNLKPIDVVQWLSERLANCQLLASQKTGHDRDGWLEDAEYFRSAIYLIADAQARLANRPPAQPSGVVEWPAKENRNG